MAGLNTPFAVCFTGHRPEKLPGGNEKRMLESLLYGEILIAVQDGARTFYAGMAQGVDIWAAEMVLSLRRQHDLRLIAVRPFPTHGGGLRGTALYRYENILRAADEIITVCPQYHPGCYKLRNAYMLEHSQRLIAVVTDMHSGTGQTIRMAEKKGMDIRRLTLESASASIADPMEGGNDPSAT